MLDCRGGMGIVQTMITAAMHLSSALPQAANDSYFFSTRVEEHGRAPDWINKAIFSNQVHFLRTLSRGLQCQ
jgi:hypothetical protein